MDAKELWSKWDGNHDTPDQTKRLASAKKADLTPVSISTETLEGRFQGSHGQYLTTLESCNCVDFVRRKLPCKHMYRLAIELGLLGDSVKAKGDKTAVKIPRSSKRERLISVVGIIENYPAEIQERIKDILLDLTYHKKSAIVIELDQDIQALLAQSIFDGYYDNKGIAESYGPRILYQKLTAAGIDFPKELKTQKAKNQWFISNSEQFKTQVFPGVVLLKLSELTAPIAIDLYKYLHRKFDKETYYDPDTGEMVEVPAGSYDKTTLTIGLDGNCSISVSSELPSDLATDVLDFFDQNPTK